MKIIRPNVILVCAALVCSAIALRASGPAGCYTMVERVIVEPNDKDPQRIQVWGLFVVSDEKPGNGYLAPQRGYLYFKLERGYEKQTLAEWEDLKKVAGTGNVITFAERLRWNGKLRKSTDKPESPDSYPTSNGITRVATGQGLGSIDNPGIIAQLKAALNTTTK